MAMKVPGGHDYVNLVTTGEGGLEEVFELEGVVGLGGGDVGDAGGIGVVAALGVAEVLALEVVQTKAGGIKDGVGGVAFGKEGGHGTFGCAGEGGGEEGEVETDFKTYPEGLGAVVEGGLRRGGGGSVEGVGAREGAGADTGAGHWTEGGGVGEEEAADVGKDCTHTESLEVAGGGEMGKGKLRSPRGGVGNEMADGGALKWVGRWQGVGERWDREYDGADGGGFAEDGGGRGGPGGGGGDDGAEEVVGAQGGQSIN